MTTDEIQKLICKDEVLKGNLPCENISANFCGEADVLSILKSGYVKEFEVKISRSDFKNDAKKDKWKFYDVRQFERGQFNLKVVTMKKLDKKIIEVCEKLDEFLEIQYKRRSTALSRFNLAKKLVDKEFPHLIIKNERELVKKASVRIEIGIDHHTFFTCRIYEGKLDDFVIKGNVSLEAVKKVIEVDNYSH